MPLTGHFNTAKRHLMLLGQSQDWPWAAAVKNSREKKANITGNPIPESSEPAVYPPPLVVLLTSLRVHVTEGSAVGGGGGCSATKHK